MLPNALPARDAHASHLLSLDASRANRTYLVCARVRPLQDPIDTPREFEALVKRQKRVWIFDIAQHFVSYINSDQLGSSSFKTYVTLELQQQGVRVVTSNHASKAAVRRGNEAYIGRRRAELAAALHDAARGGYLLVDKAVRL